MESRDKERLMKEAQKLIEKSDYSDEEKNNLKNNIGKFLSMVEKDEILKNTSWSYFDYREEYNDPEGGKGLDLVWNWEKVNGVFGFYTNNGHGFSFDFGKDTFDGCMFGGEDGEYGFSCGLFLNDFENSLVRNGLIPT